MLLVLGGADCLLTVAEVARKLRVCKASVYKLVAEGKLPHVRIGNQIRLVPSAIAGRFPQLEAAQRRRDDPGPKRPVVFVRLDGHIPTWLCGGVFEVRFYASDAGRSQPTAFLDSLPARDRAQVVADIVCRKQEQDAGIAAARARMKKL